MNNLSFKKIEYLNNTLLKYSIPDTYFNFNDDTNGLKKFINVIKLRLIKINELYKNVFEHKTISKKYKDFIMQIHTEFNGSSNKSVTNKYINISTNHAHLNNIISPEVLSLCIVEVDKLKPFNYKPFINYALIGIISGSIACSAYPEIFNTIYTFLFNKSFNNSDILQ